MPPAYQGSETSGAKVAFYSHGNDPILGIGGPNLNFQGERKPENEFALLGVSTQKAIDGGAGNWTVTLKAPRGADLFSRIIDDDWVDISLTRHGRQWHVMRGLVDDVRRATTVGGAGATSEVYSIVGRDFQKVWEETQLWFDRFNLENVAGSASNRIIDATKQLIQPPNKVVLIYLSHFLQELASYGRASWNVPKGVPNIPASRSFLESLDYIDSGFAGDPKRKAINPNMQMPNGSLWDLAKAWSDPMFTELFCDLVVDGKPPPPDQEHPIDSTRMAVFMRDKPFPLYDVPNPGSLGIGPNSAWFNLPTHVIPRQHIATGLDVGRTGHERVNAFFASPELSVEMAAIKTQLLRPLWHPGDIDKHGLRRMDVVSRYKADEATLLTMNETQRHMVRDWHCLNAYLHSGTMPLSIGRPDIRIGSRVRIPGENGEAGDEHYYVESAGHNWRYAQPIQTVLGVTRGYRGSEDNILALLEDMIDGYEAPEQNS